jgi:hypothetical protein
MRLSRPLLPPVPLNPQERQASRAGRLVAAEGEDTGLVRCQDQPACRQAWPQSRVEPFRLFPVLKRAAVI